MASERHICLAAALAATLAAAAYSFLGELVGSVLRQKDYRQRNLCHRTERSLNLGVALVNAASVGKHEADAEHTGFALAGYTGVDSAFF